MDLIATIHSILNPKRGMADPHGWDKPAPERMATVTRLRAAEKTKTDAWADDARVAFFATHTDADLDSWVDGWVAAMRRVESDAALAVMENRRADMDDDDRRKEDAETTGDV